MRKIIRQQIFFGICFMEVTDWHDNRNEKIEKEREEKKNVQAASCVASTHGIVIMNQPSQCEHPIEVNKQLLTKFS